jgi:hypothetical protein
MTMSAGSAATAVVVVLFVVEVDCFVVWLVDGARVVGSKTDPVHAATMDSTTSARTSLFMAC